MKKYESRCFKARLAFRSLYPNVVSTLQFSDKEIDYFINHPVFNYELYLSEALLGSRECNKCYDRRDKTLEFIREVLLDNNVIPF